ncbi:hypothetical protein [Conexibacter arvalis]|uniref:Tetratricopeptide repeat protein n=1 Tax=Conexibacter arvalis TaxID=912552 RepID=A0A840IGI9_9ACTN|nr:hypothetical protein [Conexibacter arvalis]MBB4663455.1 hypothetical protein [Conexibacter arvalis]
MSDVLVSALALAAEPGTLPAPAVLEHDLRKLSALSNERGFKRILVTVDDSDALLEDCGTFERLVTLLDSVGGWTLAVAATYQGAEHLAEAISPALRRFERVSLRPFWSPDRIYHCLAAPLDSDVADRLVRRGDHSFLFDVLRLTGGNPFEIALVGRHLWFACQLGEQEHYVLTPAVLERVLEELALYTGASQELIAGAKAVTDLSPERIGPALKLVALSELTTRQIAIARLLGLPNDDDRIARRLLTADLDDEQEKVIAELEALETDGVVTLCDDGRFTVQGGPAAALALKYQARIFAGDQASDVSFEIPFLACVGEPLVKDCATRVSERIGEATRLGHFFSIASRAYAPGARMRHSLNAVPFAGLEVDVMPFGDEEFDLMAAVIRGTEDLAIALVNFSVGSDGEELSRGEIWVLPSAEWTAHQINEIVSEEVDDWMPIVVAAEMTWSGSHVVVLRNDDARKALTQLIPAAAFNAMHAEFRDWDGGDPEAALALATRTVAALRGARVQDTWDLSIALSHLGFVRSLFEDRLSEARDALIEALERGPADGWPTQWNLANVSARAGDSGHAIDVLDRLRPQTVNAPPDASVTFFVPGRLARDTMVSITEQNALAMLDLQRLVIGFVENPDRLPDLERALVDAINPETAEWVARLIAHRQAQ